ncbi:MAG: hypothetical protein AAF527_00415 [Pseudomonadota bacterium]
MQRHSRLTEQDYKAIAELMVRRHGDDAVYWADCAIDELDAQGERWRADAWRALRIWVIDCLGLESDPALVGSGTVH